MRIIREHYLSFARYSPLLRQQRCNKTLTQISSIAATGQSARIPRVSFNTPTRATVPLSKTLYVCSLLFASPPLVSFFCYVSFILLTYNFPFPQLWLYGPDFDQVARNLGEVSRNSLKFRCGKPVSCPKKGACDAGQNRENLATLAMLSAAGMRY